MGVRRFPGICNRLSAPFYQFLQLQIVGGRYMSFLVGFDALDCVVDVNIEVLQLIEDFGIKRRVVDANHGSRHLGQGRWPFVEPGVLLYL